MRDLQLVPIRRLIDDVVLHGRRHWRQILPSIALVMFGIGLMAVLLQEKQLELAQSQNPSLDEVLEIFGLLLPLSFVILVIYMVAFSAVMVACMDALEGRTVNMKRAWGFSMRPQVFLTNGAVWFFTGLSALCCFLPVLYVGPILTFTLPIMVHRGIYGFKAMGASIELSKYNPSGRWREGTFVHILGVLLAGALINYAVTMLVQLPLIVMQAVMAFRQASSGDLSAAPLPPLWMQIPTQGLVALVTTASWIYWCFGIAALYREVLRRREGGDLQDAIDQMTAPAYSASGYPQPIHPGTADPLPPAPSVPPSPPVPPAPDFLDAATPPAPTDVSKPPSDPPPDDTSGSRDP